MGDCTENFSYSEFLVSSSFPDLARKMSFDEYEKFKVYCLCAIILEPVRRKFGAPIRITSGKRSAELNEKIGGSETSDHLFIDECACCDFAFDNSTYTLGAFHHIKENMKDKIGQLILYERSGGIAKHVHVSLPSRKNQGEIYISKPGGSLIIQ